MQPADVIMFTAFSKEFAKHRARVVEIIVDIREERLWTRPGRDPSCFSQRCSARLQGGGGRGEDAARAEGRCAAARQATASVSVGTGDISTTPVRGAGWAQVVQRHRHGTDAAEARALQPGVRPHGPPREDGPRPGIRTSWGETRGPGMIRCDAREGCATATILRPWYFLKGTLERENKRAAI
eukprot:gene11473-biopygen18399